MPRPHHDPSPAARDAAPQVTPLPVPTGSIVLPAAALFALTVLVFSPVLGHPFLRWDDGLFIVQNPAYNPPTAASLLGYWTQLKPSVQFYVPVMQSIWWGLAALTGHPGSDGHWVLSAAPFHAANLLAHATGAVLVFALLWRLTHDRAAAWMGAAVYALHPVQVEAIAWAATFYTPLSATFALAAILLLSHHLELRHDVPDGPSSALSERSRRRRMRLALAAGTLCFLAALLSKPGVVLAPAIAAVLEVGLRRRPWRQVAAPVLAWTLLSVPVMVVAKLAQPPTFPYWPFWHRPFLAADAVAFYLSKIVLPISLATDYGRSPDWLAQSGVWRYTWAVPVVVAAGLSWVSVRRKSAWPLACGAVFLAAALPTLGFTPFQYQLYSTVADRYVYFAMFAVALAAAHGLALARAPRARTLAFAIATCILTAFAVTSHLQTYKWRDTLVLFRHTLEVNPDSLVANMLLADADDAAGRPAEAFEHLRRAFEAHPESRLAQVALADFLYGAGRYEDAVTYYEQAVAPPNPPSALLFSKLGTALSQCGRQTEAAASLRKAIEVQPNFVDARLSLAVVNVRLREFDAARAQFEEVLKLDPHSTAARDGLAQLRATNP